MAAFRNSSPLPGVGEMATGANQRQETLFFYNPIAFFHLSPCPAIEGKGESHTPQGIELPESLHRGSIGSDLE